jgi:DNA recombination protein RmuC
MPLDWLSAALLLVLVVLTLWIALRRAPLPDVGLERHGREMREEVARSAQATRQELAQSLALFQQTLLAQQGDTARTQNEQIDSFSRQLAAMQQHLAETQNAHGARQASSLKDLSDSLAARLHALVEANDRGMAETKATVEARLFAIQSDNEKKLEQIRATVDEKLHATLEQRLGESFRQVAERLDTVHRGLNDMRAIARDVGSLNRILTNVKTRGSFGEWQLGALLEDVMTLDQFARNVETIPGSNARIEFAIRMPGRPDAQPQWLPIDAKFPREDYERLLDAQERADAVGATAAAKAIDQRLRLEARTIREKYVAPPHTTEYAILFVPSEGLYAEMLRRPGLFDALHRDHRIVLAGPTTLTAILSSLQAGHRSYALEKRSTEVWEVLGAVKTEFARFGETLAKTKKKLDEASNTIDDAQRRTNAMSRQLRNVEALPEQRTQSLLPRTLDDDADE